MGRQGCPASFFELFGGCRRVQSGPGRSLQSRWSRIKRRFKERSLFGEILSIEPPPFTEGALACQTRILTKSKKTSAPSDAPTAWSSSPRDGSLHACAEAPAAWGWRPSWPPAGVPGGARSSASPGSWHGVYASCAATPTPDPAATPSHPVRRRPPLLCSVPL